ncbi:MAG: hypothetical protein QW304_02795 [Thermoproteota archaeon]
MRYRAILVIIIVLIIGGYFGYQYYAEYRSRSDRISSLMKYANITDYDKAASFDKKYNYLAIKGEYNETVLIFFSYWYSNSSLADYYLNNFKSIQEAIKHLLRFTRLLSLMRCFNTTDYAKVSVFYDKYSYLVTESCNESFSEFFSYWCLNNTLADLSLEILGSIQEVNQYLSRLSHYVVNYGSKDNLTLILSASTDKDEYSTSDDKAINFTIIVLSNSDLGNIPVTIFGFKNRYGRYVVNNRWINYTGVLEITVNKGLNIKSLSIDIPACSACTGVSAGLHNLTCVIIYNSLNVNVTKYLVLR